MNVTLTLPDDLVKQCRKIAVDRGTTLTGLIRGHLELLAPQQVSPGERKRRWAAMEESFRTLKINSDGKRWTREERNERPGASAKQRTKSS
ncbi:MAG: hypothetical protein ABI811_11965 [Acidobacteriota bacterium]